LDLLLHDLLLLSKQKHRQTRKNEGAAAHAAGGAAEKTASVVDIMTVVYPFRCRLFCSTTCCMGSCTFILLSFHTKFHTNSLHDQHDCVIASMPEQYFDSCT